MTESHDMLHQLLGRSCPGAQLATDDVLKKIISKILKLESMCCLATNILHAHAHAMKLMPVLYHA